MLKATLKGPRLAPGTRLKIDLEDHGVTGLSGQQPHPIFRPERASPQGYQRLISERFRAHPQAAIIESMPGMGPILGAEFVVATGSSLASFATSGHLAAYAGLVPVPQDSGRVTGNLRRPQRYNRRLRHVFYMAAFSSIKAEGPSRAFYERKRGERLTHTQALLALARRLVDVLWALLRDGRFFTAAPPPPAARAA